MGSINRKICTAAKIYDDAVVGKKFRFKYEGEICYLTFSKTQFAHLVGVSSKDNSQFFKKACEGTLTNIHYYYSKSQNRNNCLAKLSVFEHFFNGDNKYIQVYNDELLIHVSDAEKAVLKIKKVPSNKKETYYMPVSLIRKCQRGGTRLYFENVNNNN